jgi:hypothetical protein
VHLGLAAGAVMLVGTLSAAAPAQAQFYVGPFGPRVFAISPPGYIPGHPVYRERRMHPSMIVEDLEDRGFRDLVLVSRRPDVYVIEGMSPRREPIRLIVDAYDGEILERFTRGPVTSALAPLPTPPVRRTLPEAAPKSAPPPKVAGPEPAPRASSQPVAPATPTAPAVVVRPRSSDWAPINSVPVSPLE